MIRNDECRRLPECGSSPRSALRRALGGAAVLALALAAVGCAPEDQHAGHAPTAPAAASQPGPAATAPAGQVPTSEPETAAATGADADGADGADGAAGAMAPADSETATLRLGLNEWNIKTDATQLRPGPVEVQVTNAGGTAHDVVIHGEQGSWASPVLEPGQRHTMRISVLAGEELELICTLVGHHAQGMHTTLTVEAGP